MQRHGMTVPFDGQHLHAQRDRFQRLEALGYTDLWSAEAMGADGLTPLALGAVWTPSLRLGTAILPAYTRGPALMAQSVAAMASAAPGRFVAGIGSSSNVIVERWNGIPFEEPYRRTRDMVRFLRTALTGEKVAEDYDTFSVKGFRLGLVPEQPVPILVAALREGMLRMAGREGDGAIINWLSADDVARVAGIVREENADAEIVARIFVAPTADREAALATGKFAAAAYLNVPVYRAFHEWMGRGDDLAEHWEQWEAGDRQGALEKIPDHVIDELIVHGDPDACRAHVQRYVDNGVTCPALMIMPFPGVDVDEAIEALAPERP
jgi:probable F420-dependent oxidoreductase